MVATRRTTHRFADILIEKGYRRIHLLFDETPEVLTERSRTPQSRMGDAKQLLMHSEERMSKDCTFGLLVLAFMYQILFAASVRKYNIVQYMALFLVRTV